MVLTKSTRITNKQSPSGLQKIIRCFAGSIRFNLPWCWIKLKKTLLHVFPYFKNRSHISTPITIIWRAKYRHHVLFLQTTISKFKFSGIQYVF
ncbi:hypothetical protein Hanom_Chr17g01548311 [Helianthus anomalus]